MHGRRPTSHNRNMSKVSSNNETMVSDMSSYNCPDPIQRLNNCFGQGEPGLQRGTVQRWADFKDKISTIRQKILFKRMRQILVYNKQQSCTDLL